MKRKSKLICAIRKFLFLYSFALSVTHAHASSFVASNCSYWLHPFLTLTIGASNTNIGESQNFFIDDTRYDYSSNVSRARKRIWGASIGTEILLKPQLNLQLGVAYYQPSSPFKQNGVLTQGLDPQSSDQFPYDYHIQTSQLLAESKLLFNLACLYHPYVSFGIGAAFNKGYAYQVTFPPLLTFTPLFGDHTNTAFSYSIGFGIDIDLVQPFRVGAGYRFADFGKSKLASGIADVMPIAKTLQQTHLYTQELVLQLTYVIA